MPGAVPALALDLPGALAQHGHGLAALGDAVDVELGAADHEVDVDLAPIDARPLELVLDLVAEAVAERDVAGRILVEEGVEEDRSQRTDPPAPVDERELSEVRRALVLGHGCPQRLGILVGIDLCHPTAVEFNPETADDR